MQFSTAIFTLLASAVALTSALPNPVPSPNGSPPPTSVCSQGTVENCCNKDDFLPIVGGFIGIQCLPISVIAGGQCSPQQQLACCEASGNSVISVGPVCPNILVL